MIQEQWKIIEEFPNYMVSDLGNVKRIKTNKILKADSVKGGYLRVKLYNKDNVKKVLIHRIVCQSFIPEFMDEMEIDHINCNTQDNRLVNLKPCNHTENMNNPITKDKLKCYTKKGIPVYQYTKNKEVLKKWDSIKEASIELGISMGNISSCCTGKRETAGGFIWTHDNNKIKK